MSSNAYKQTDQQSYTGIDIYFTKIEMVSLRKLVIYQKA